MRFTPANCPECGQLAHGTLETVPGIALLVFDDNGNAEYEGETKIDWDSQVSQRDEAGRVLLECSEGHQWPAERRD